MLGGIVLKRPARGLSVVACGCKLVLVLSYTSDARIDPGVDSAEALSPRAPIESHGRNAPSLARIVTVVKSAARAGQRSLLELLQAREGPNRGSYATEAEALAATRARGRRIGYDHPEAAQIYLHEIAFMRTSDYPVVFWLEKKLRSGFRVFDWGGNIGHSFHAYRQYLSYPPDMTWTICDVAAITQMGAELARRSDAPQLAFTTDPHDCEGSDVLLVSGALQFIPLSLESLLGSLRIKPSVIIINRTPVHPTRSYYTLQDIGPAVCPYQVFSESELLANLAAFGYVLRDRWPCEGKALRIPFRPRDTIERYSGFFFELASNRGTPEQPGS